MSPNADITKKDHLWMGTSSDFAQGLNLPVYKALELRQQGPPI